MSNDGRRRRAVRAHAEAKPGVPQPGERRDPAAEQRVRARAVRRRDVVADEQLELLVVEMDAVRADDLRAEQPVLGEDPDGVRRDAHAAEHVGERAAPGARPTRPRLRSRRSASSPARPARSRPATARATR